MVLVSRLATGADWFPFPGLDWSFPGLAKGSDWFAGGGVRSGDFQRLFSLNLTKWSTLGPSVFVVLGFSGRFLSSVPPGKSFSISETHETLSGWTLCDLGCKHSLSLTFGFPGYVAFVSMSISLFFFGSCILNPD